MYSLTHLLVVASASPVAMASSLWARASNENVILADCTGVDNTTDLSSECAYFSGTPDSSPDDISVVTGWSHQSWANRTTSAFFSDTSVTFTAVLGESGEAGDYAGTGTNGYANFTCWQMASTYLYTHINRNCYVVYDCNHLGAPATLPSASPSTSATSTPTASATAASSGLSTSAIVGLSVGVALGVLLFVGIAALLLWRHWRPNRESKAAAQLKEKGPESGPPGTPKPYQPVDPIWQGPGARELETPQFYHELSSDTYPVEAHGEAIRGELDGNSARVELHSHDLPPKYDHDHSIDATAGAYGNFKGPV
ncbi:hypothetical protein GGR53DRAFT_493179 [Hypoxylon sp. FL1150]|nr:hypothetical protein GGR53DRAFT_493179 [Hypoxylon sp. FL1150]